MPPALVKVSTEFSRAVKECRDLVADAERMHLTLLSAGGEQFIPAQDVLVEYLYEFAYLKMFVSWEVFLEESFVRYMSGHRSPTYGREAVPAGVTRCRKIEEARRRVTGGGYWLWANVGRTLTMMSAHLAPGRHDMVMRGAIRRLEYFANIRHRIAHGNSDAITKFRGAVAGLGARGKFGLRTGRFLRAFNTTAVPNVRWIEFIARELEGYARAIV